MSREFVQGNGSLSTFHEPNPRLSQLPQIIKCLRLETTSTVPFYLSWNTDIILGYCSRWCDSRTTFRFDCQRSACDGKCRIVNCAIILCMFTSSRLIVGYVLGDLPPECSARTKDSISVADPAKPESVGDLQSQLRQGRVDAMPRH